MWGLTLGLLGLAAWTALGQVPPADSTAERTVHWQEDLRVLSTTLSAKGSTVDFQRGISTRGQKDFDKLYPRFRIDIEALDADIPRLADGEIVLRLMRIVAGANVAHNLVQPPIGLGFFSRLPLDFVWYADGLAVMAASAEYDAALGSRVLKIGEKTPEQVLAELAPYVAHETDAWLRQNAVGLLRPRVVLEHLGLTDSAGRVMLTLQKPNGTALALTIKTVDPRTKMVAALDALHVPAPLSWSHPNQYYWHQYLDDSRTLYIQYKVCANDPKLPFSDFAASVLADADARPVNRVVIDMRANGGGDSRIVRPLESGLKARLGKLGHVFILIGPQTFSSGTDNAIELRDSLHATLMGEPTGGSVNPSSYGEVKYVTLPNSKLTVQYTTKGSRKDTDQDALMPDVPVPNKLADVLSGRDRALEAAFTAR